MSFEEYYDKYIKRCNELSKEETWEGIRIGDEIRRHGAFYFAKGTIENDDQLRKAWNEIYRRYNFKICNGYISLMKEIRHYNATH